MMKNVTLVGGQHAGLEIGIDERATTIHMPMREDGPPAWWRTGIEPLQPVSRTTADYRVAKVAWRHLDFDARGIEQKTEGMFCFAFHDRMDPIAALDAMAYGYRNAKEIEAANRALRHQLDATTAELAELKQKTQRLTAELEAEKLLQKYGA